MAKDLDSLLKQMNKYDKNFNIYDPSVSEHNGLVLNKSIKKKKKWKHSPLKK